MNINGANIELRPTEDRIGSYQLELNITNGVKFSVLAYYQLDFRRNKYLNPYLNLADFKHVDNHITLPT